MASNDSEDAVDVLERRLNTIERKVFGQDSKKGPIPIPNSGAVGSSATPAVSKLTEMAKECGNALESRERIAPILRKFSDLETYLVNKSKLSYVLPKSEKTRHSKEFFFRLSLNYMIFTDNLMKQNLFAMSPLK